MIKRNNRGFTLIEAIISFAILAIASTMIAVGLLNMSNIFTEATLIKDTTNDLYENVSKQENVSDDLMSNMMTFTIGNMKKEVSGKMVYSQSNVEYGDQTMVRLSQFYPTVVAEKIPSEVEEKGMSARFYIATNMADIPQNYDEFKKVYKSYISLGSSGKEHVYHNSLNSGCAFNVFNTDITSHLLKSPSESDLSNGIKEINSTYQKFIGDSYTISWIYASNESVDGVINVYGYLEPKIKEPTFCIKYDDEFVWIPYSLGFDGIMANVRDEGLTKQYYVFKEGFSNPYDVFYDKHSLTQFMTQVVNAPYNYKDFIYIESVAR